MNIKRTFPSYLFLNDYMRSLKYDQVIHSLVQHTFAQQLYQRSYDFNNFWRVLYPRSRCITTFSTVLQLDRNVRNVVQSKFLHKASCWFLIVTFCSYLQHPSSHIVCEHLTNTNLWENIYTGELADSRTRWDLPWLILFVI